MLVRLIGLQLDGSHLLPVLKIAVTYPVFQSEGN